MEKIKLIINQWLESDKGKDILVVIIVILVGLGSFELGRLSKQDTSGIKILPAQVGEYPSQNIEQGANAVSSVNYSSLLQNTRIEKNSTGKKFFASTKGTKYYSIGCSAGKNIKQENRIYFATGEEAQKAGYELSSSCS